MRRMSAVGAITPLILRLASGRSRLSASLRPRRHAAGLAALTDPSANPGRLVRDGLDQDVDRALAVRGNLAAGRIQPESRRCDATCTITGEPARLIVRSRREVPPAANDRQDGHRGLSHEIHEPEAKNNQLTLG